MLPSKNPKLTLSDLKLGMSIKDKSQLDNIYDTWIILTKQPHDSDYKVEFIGKETNTDSDKLFKQGKQICPVYNDSLELEGDIFCEE